MDEASGLCKFTCGVCQTPLMARIPTIRIYNFPETSGCVMVHERPVKCPKCDARYVAIFQSISGDGKIQFGWRQVPDTKQPSTAMTDLTGNMEVDQVRKRIQEERQKHEQTGTDGKRIQ